MTDLEKRDAEAFFHSVMSDCNHYGWAVEWYDSTIEGYCWEHRKAISLGPESKNIRNLIIHEIAHIGTCIGENNRHGPEWQKEFSRLCLRYGEDPMVDGAYRFYVSQ